MYYKLTNQRLQTYNNCQWKIGKWKRINDDCRGSGLCTQSWFHCYSSPLLAVLLSPIHINIKDPRLFRVEVKGKKLSDKGLKYGFTMMRLVQELPLPEITVTQKVAFAILCVKEINRSKKWDDWADNWLSGKDRSSMTSVNIVETLLSPTAYAAKVSVFTATQAVNENPVAKAIVAHNAACTAVEVSAVKTIDLIKIAKKAMKF